MADNVKLGSTYVDPITGFQGTAVIRERHLTGSIMIGLARKPDDFTLKRGGADTAFFDEARLDFVDSLLDRLAKPLDAPLFKLGQEVCHKIDPNIKGIITRIMEQINGCVHLVIQFPYVPDPTDNSPLFKTPARKELSLFNEDQKMFKLIGPGLSEGDNAVKPSPGTGCCIDDFKDAPRY